MEDLANLKEEEIGMCYIESKNLDGEINLRFKQANFEMSKNYKKEEDFSQMTGVIECTPPNELLNDFGAKYYEDPNDFSKFINLDKQTLLLRGCTLKKTICIFGIATYLGHNTKMLKNFPTFKYKQASIESKLNNYIYILFIVDLIICFALSTIGFYDNRVNFTFKIGI